MFNQQIFSKPTFLGILFVLLISCGGGEETGVPFDPPIEPEVIIPSNLSLTLTIVGKDENNINGDGSGVIQASASATDAMKYGFRFGTGAEIESSTGNIEFTYTEKGTNTYTIYVYAYSTTGDSINVSQEVTIFVTPDSFSTLIFSDEFDVAGSLDSSKWNYDIGKGNNGWGNGESQYYTNRTDNVIIEDGFLKIIAKKETYQGSEYTSTRIKTQGKFDFTYGKVEVRAKLPEGGGTWPAIWMLGSNITTVGWPACGETDIMEHVGNNQGTVQSAMHTPSSYGNTVNKGAIYEDDVSTTFHVYAVKWTSEKMEFSMDDEVFYIYNPSTKNNTTWPFDANQFIILNVAMGGSFGGAIDSNFTQSTMEIDYVRVYQ
jgi:glycosyl hydrolase family 16